MVCRWGLTHYPPPPVDVRAFVEGNSVEHVLCSFSGGKDSLVATHLAHRLLSGCGVPVEVIFVDTTIGLPVVRAYVEEVSRMYGWRLVVLSPRRSFFEIASRQGMPTPRTRWCVRQLKLVPLLEYAASLGKRRVLFVTGLRREESRRRSGLRGLFYRYYRGVEIFYVDPIVNWSDGDVERYIEENGLPVNPAYRLVGFSGECLCVVFAKLDQLVRVAREYPDLIERFRTLEDAWRSGKFSGKNYRVFYAGGLKLGVDDLLNISREHRPLT